MSYILKLANLFISKYGNDITDHLLKKRITQDKASYISSKMIERGIIPIVTHREGEPSETSFLGKGAYSKAYEVSYKGKLAVAKVTNSKRDYYSLINLHEMSNSFGKDSKHIAKVFDYFEVPESPDEGFYDHTYVIVVEKLNPINSHIMSMLFPSYHEGESKSYYKQITSQVDIPDLMNKIIMHLNANDNEFKKLNQFKKDKFLLKLESVIRRAILTSNTKIDLDQKLHSNVEKLFQELEMDIPGSQFYPISSYEILDMIGYNVSFPIGKGPFNDPEKKIPYFLNRPETKSFLSFLIKLHNEFGITWDDLHSSNIMERPVTHDLVISDPGLFRGLF